MLNWRDPENPLSGGAERVTLGYLAALVERGHEVAWFSFAFPGGAPETRIRGIHVVRGGDKGTAVLHARRWHARQPRFDLVIDQHHGIPWYAPWWCGTNNISYIHEVLGPIWDAFYQFPWNFIGKTQERWTHKLYRNVQFWTGCHSTRRQLLGHGVRNVKVIHYGVDIVALPELEPKQPGTPLRLVMVSRLAPNKRIDHGILAAGALSRRGVPCQITVVGGGEDESRLRSVVQEHALGAMVRFTGPLSEEEKNRVLRESDLLLHTSQREGWGLNVVEANAMGTPAAVYPVPGLIDSTRDDDTGVVAKGESPVLLADRISGLVANPAEYQRLRRNAWQFSKELHWSQILPPACDWLEEMARRPHAKR